MKHLFLIIPPVLALAACMQRPIEPPPGEHPIDTVVPPQGTPVATAWCKGENLTMALDTGAAQDSLLFSPSASNLGARIRGKGPIQTAKLPISLRKDDPPISRDQDVIMLNEAPYDGLLGWKTIRRFVWNLNYPKGNHQFYTSLPPRVKKWNKLQLVKNSDFAQIRDNTGRRIIIDTGAPHALYISKKRWERFKLDYPDAVVSVYSGYSPAAGGFYALECMRIKSYNIGSLELRNIVACESFADKDVMGIEQDIDVLLGIGAFYGREFWLDGPSHNLYFSSRRPTQAAFPTFNNVGATFIPQQDGSPPYTARVTTWSTAWQSGLRNGDVLLSLNGRKRPDMALIDYVTTQTGAEAEMTVRRKNKLVTLSWTVPQTPEPGEYHPTPEAMTDEDFEKRMQEEQIKAEQSGPHPPALSGGEPAATL